MRDFQNLWFYSSLHYRHAFTWVHIVRVHSFLLLHILLYKYNPICFCIFFSMLIRLPAGFCDQEHSYCKHSLYRYFLQNHEVKFFRRLV